MFRERALIYGPTGGGKSSMWLDMFFHEHPLFQNAKFFILDADHAVEAMIPDSDQFERLKVLPTLSLQTARKNLKPFLTKAQKGDIAVLDMQSSIWNMIQAYTKENYFNVKRDEAGMFKNAEVLDKNRAEFWQVCNDIMWSWFSDLMTSPAHIFALASQRALRTQGMLADDPELQQVYKKTGQVPVGSTRDGHYFHTIIHAFSTSDHNYRVTSVKERAKCQDDPRKNRATVDKAIVTNKSFVDWYLRDIAKWPI